MKRPEQTNRIWAFSGKQTVLMRFVVAVIVLIAIIVSIISFFIHSHQIDLFAQIVFFFLAVVGFSVMVAFLSGVFNGVGKNQGKECRIPVDSLDDAVLLADTAGHIITANASCRKLLGFENAKTVFGLFSLLQDAEQVIYRLSAKALAGTAAREETHAARSLWKSTSGSNQAWYSLAVKPIKLHGEVFFVWRLEDIGFARDMYEPLFRNLQEAINHLDQAPAGFLSVDHNGSIIYLNATLSNALNIDLSKFKTGELTFDSVFKTSGQAPSWVDIKKHIDESGNNYRFSVDWHNTQDDRTTFIILAAKQAGDEEDESIYRLVLVPASSRSVSEPGSDTTLDVLRYYFENSPLAIATIDREGKLLAANKPFKLLINVNQDDLNRKSVSEFFTDAGKRDIDEILRKLSANRAGNLTTEVSPSTNENRHFRLFFLKVSKEIDQPENEMAILSVIETTAQKTLEDKMAQGQKLQAVGQLAGGIAHDFNNVLTAIIMSCDLLLASHRSSDPAHADLINIKNNANRAASLVQQLLAFSRRQTLRPEVVDLTELLSDVRNLLMPLLGSNIHLKFNHGRDLWDVKVDQASFQRVLMNLVINARDAMPDGGSITISTANVTRQQIADLSFDGLVTGDYVELDVEDTGTGIPKAVQEKMFEPFFTTKEVGKGTGLGLSMVYGIVKQTGGYIYCESEEGKGTKFRIFLPRFIAEVARNDQKTVEPEKLKAEKNADLSGTATVLLVEDEAAVRMGGLRALQSRGYTVLEAENGVEALDVIAEHNGAVDLVVSDVVMPEMDGPTLLGEMRKKYPDIKFVFVSGYAKDAFAKNLPPDAVFGFLSKPFTLKQLAMKVKEMLSDKDVSH